MAQEKAKEPCFSCSEPNHVVVGDEKKRKEKGKRHVKGKILTILKIFLICEQIIDLHSKDGE